MKLNDSQINLLARIRRTGSVAGASAVTFRALRRRCLAMSPGLIRYDARLTDAGALYLDAFMHGFTSPRRRGP